MNVLFIDRVHDILEEMLSGAGYNCVHDYESDKASVERKIGNYEGIVIRSRIPIDAEFLLAADNLKFIARAGAGLENIDLQMAQSRGVKVFSVPEANRDAVGEHAVGALLMLLHHLKRADAEVRQGIWRRAENRGTELGGLTVGIIGLGNMGSAFAEKLRGFGCHIIAYDKYQSNGPTHVKHVSLEQLQEKADVISFHVPLTEETHFYFNTAFLKKCRKPIYLLNTARGKVVETEAVVEGLQTGQVLGAYLDVLEYESRSFEHLNASRLPAAFQYLLESEKVVLSPHIAGWTHDSHFKLSRFLGDKILGYFKAP